MGAVPGTQDFTRSSETRWQHALKKYNKDINAVQAIEVWLGIANCWVIGGPQCVKMAKLVSMHKYQHALDDLEGLVVAQIFELTNINWAQAGWLFVVPSRLH